MVFQQVVDYGIEYMNARLKAMKSKLLSPEEMRELTRLNTVNELIELLEESPYKKAFVTASIKHKGLELVSKALDLEMAWVIKKILGMSPKKILPIVEILLKQWEVSNLKIILASKALGRELNKEDLVITSSASGRLYDKLLALDFNGLLKEFYKTEYRHVFEKALKEFGKTGDFRVLMTALDEYSHFLLASLEPVVDETSLKFIKNRITFANAMTILRMKKTGVPAKTISKYLLSGGNARLAKELLHEKTLESTVEKLFKELGLRQGALDAFKETGSLIEVETELERRLLLDAKKTLSRSVLSPGVVIGYLHLKHEEVHSIKKIAYATEFDLKKELHDAILSM